MGSNPTLSTNFEKEERREMLTLYDWQDSLFSTFKTSSPLTNAIINAVHNNNFLFKHTDLFVDHISFRTLGIYPFNIAGIEQNILRFGYFAFADGSNGWIRWRKYATPGPGTRIFVISEPIHEMYSPETQDLIKNLCNRVPKSHCDVPSIFFNHAPWRDKVTLKEYETTKNESEYVSWVMLNGATPDHISLRLRDDVRIDELNEFINGLNVRTMQALNLPDGSIHLHTEREHINGSFKCDEHTLKALPTGYIGFVKRTKIERFDLIV